MELIMNFLEQYWGLTICGGITLGGLVTALIGLFKVVKGNNIFKNENGILTSKINQLIKFASTQEEKLEALAQENKKLIAEKVAQNEYFNKVQALTFEGLSYLIMSSKMPSEDKASLMKKFTTLTNTTEQQVYQASERAIDKITNTAISVNNTVDKAEQRLDESKSKADDLVQDVVGVIEKSQSLLDKYNV